MITASLIPEIWRTRFWPRGFPRWLRAAGMLSLTAPRDSLAASTGMSAMAIRQPQLYKRPKRNFSLPRIIRIIGQAFIWPEGPTKRFIEAGFLGKTQYFAFHRSGEGHEQARFTARAGCHARRQCF